MTEQCYFRAGRKQTQDRGMHRSVPLSAAAPPSNLRRRRTGSGSTNSTRGRGCGIPRLFLIGAAMIFAYGLLSAIMLTRLQGGGSSLSSPVDSKINGMQRRGKAAEKIGETIDESETEGVGRNYVGADDARWGESDGKVAGVSRPMTDETAAEDEPGSDDGDRGDKKKGGLGGLHGRPSLTAYLETVQQSDWSVRPLPVRNTTSSDLKVRRYPSVNSCSRFAGQFPVDDPPTDVDPFLPWIHDVFPSADGSHVQFVAQNKRRCQTGREMGLIKEHMQPQAALFQHVPVKRIRPDEGGGNSDDEVRYRLSSHEDADPDGMETRFICRFRRWPEMSHAGETLSVHNFNYDYHTYRKRYKNTFTKDGFDNHMIWSSQLLFRCPVPEALRAEVAEGRTVAPGMDYPDLFVDVIPIRTPPRYGPPHEFLPPRYQWEAEKADWFFRRNAKKANESIGAYLFDTNAEWGDSHLLPRAEDSGRWENIPVCMPSLMTYGDSVGGEGSGEEGSNAVAIPQNMADGGEENGGGAEVKRWDLIACVWTSASFHTRGERRHITDNVDRLREWLEFNFLTDFDHVVIYDNSAAQAKTGVGTEEGGNLKSVVDLFPGRATHIPWPAKVCNNRPGTGDNKGERSSQYAAESSCRLRFGQHSQWLGSFDIDEYMTPMGDYGSMKEVLRDREKDGVKILSFKSMRAWPRLNYLEDPEKSYFKDKECRQGCFHPSVRENTTFLQAYNCDTERPPRMNVMSAEKQIYKPDYVLLHFVHYSTVTTISVLNKKETVAAGYNWVQGYKDQHTKVSDEELHATMLHSKSIVYDQTSNHEANCKQETPNCKLGFPYPPGKDERDWGEVKDENGFLCNCFVNRKIEEYWVPRLDESLGKR